MHLSIYTWGYLITDMAGRSCRKIIRFSECMRVNSSDWVGHFVWGSPNVTLAPPIKSLEFEFSGVEPPRKNDAMLSLNIDTYVDYVDK